MTQIINEIRDVEIQNRPAGIVDFDVAIVGGGMAGLSLSIQLAKLGHHIVLFEKEQYPFHKVCGEYISLESWNFLVSLGLDLEKINPPIISKLQVSSVNGKITEHKLPLGGFGLSRYKLDHCLAQVARAAGVTVLENSKVTQVSFDGSIFHVESSRQQYTAKLACGSFGKRSNIDIRWSRKFVIAAKNRLNNYIGVKYHIKTKFPSDTIALHNFKNGYCGIVQIGDDQCCLCYLTTAANLQRCNGSVAQMEQSILCQNPHLETIFSNSEFLYKEPLTISQISFDKKDQVENHVLMIGDAAGMITPLCGNGMSMALHASKLAADQIDPFLKNKITRAVAEEQYSLQWNRNFSQRLKTGRRIQRLFGHKWITNYFIALVSRFPKLVDILIRQTHGEPF